MHWSLFRYSEPSQQRPVLCGPPLSKTTESIMHLENLVDPKFLTEMVEGYLTCAVCSSMNEDGESLYDSYDLDDLDVETRLRMQSDCACFLAEAWEALSRVDMAASTVGNYFWLTRNGHGAGFWDLGLGEFGERLTKAAKIHGSYDLYEGEGEEGEVKLTGCDG